MPLPSTGWLTSPQGQDFEHFPLPEQHDAMYSDGGNGEIYEESILWFPSLVNQLVGSVQSHVHVGWDTDDAKVAVIVMSRTGAYGALLVDTAIYPSIEDRCFVEPSTPYEGTDVPEEVVAPDTEPYVCAIGTVVAASEVAGVAVAIGEVKPDVGFITTDECIDELELAPLWSDGGGFSDGDGWSDGVLS